MPGRDLSGELFGSATSGAQDLSNELGLALAPRNQAPISRTEKFIKGIRDPIDAGAQLLTNMLPAGFVEGGNRLNNFLADKTGLVARLPEGGVDQMTREAEREYQLRRKAAGESGFDAYRTTGNVLSPANLAVASRLPVATTLAGRIGTGVLGGGISGAMTPVSEGDFLSEKGKQIAAGGAFGGAIPGAASALGRVISPRASTNANLQLLKAEGVTPTIGQALGGGASRLEEKVQSAPILGDMIGKARQAANTSFERATINRALKPVGQSLPPGLTGREAITHTENVLRDQYDTVLNNIGAIPVDSGFTSKVANLQSMVNRMLMPKAEKQKFLAALDDVNSSIDANGVITSDVYKTLESSLGSDARRLAGSQNIYEGKLAPAVQQLRAELQDMLKRQAGAHADDLKSVNAGWANFKRVQRAASAIGAEEGNFSPAQFQNAVKALDKSKDKGAFARGSALGQDLGDAGKVVLGNRVPNSGTADRMLLNVGALGSGAISPAIPIGLGAGALAYTSPVQRALVGAVSSRPASAQQTADLLRTISPFALGASGQLGMGLLNQ